MISFPWKFRNLVLFISVWLLCFIIVILCVLGWRFSGLVFIGPCVPFVCDHCPWPIGNGLMLRNIIRSLFILKWGTWTLWIHSGDTVGSGQIGWWGTWTLWAHFIVSVVLCGSGWLSIV